METEPDPVTKKLDCFYGWVLLYVVMLFLMCMYSVFSLFSSRLISHILCFFRLGTFVFLSFFQFTSLPKGGWREGETALANSPVHTLMHWPLRLMLIQVIHALTLMLFLHSHSPRLIRAQVYWITIHHLLRCADDVRNQPIK